MTRRRARRSALAVGLVSLALILALGLRTHFGAPSPKTPLGGQSAPEVSGTNLVNGASLSLAKLRGRFVVVDFFASWCGPCLSEEPQIEAFNFAHRNDQGVGFIGVDIDDSVNNARNFMIRYGATWPLLVDTSGSIAQSYGVAQPPELFLVDPAGKIVSSISQAVTSSELTNWIREARLASA